MKQKKNSSLKNTASEDIRRMKLTDAEIDEIIRPFVEQIHAAMTKGSGVETPAWPDYLKRIRRVAILRLIRQGKSNAKIIEEIMDRWGIKKDMTVKRYIDDALTDLKDLDSEPLIKKQAIEEMLRDTMEKCMAEGRTKEAMAALDMLNKMGGNYINKLEAEIKTEIEFNFGGDYEKDNG